MARPATLVGDAGRDNGTEDAIYQAAVELMAARGYHGTSLRDLAGAVGMQMSSLYYYFPSKQHLLVAIMSRTMNDMQASVEPAIRGPEGPWDQLEAGIRAHVMFHAERSDETIITDSELRALEGDNRAAIIALRDAYSDLFMAVLTRGKRAGAFQFENIHVVTNTLMSMSSSVAVWYQPSGRLSLSQISKQLSDLFLVGVAAARPDR
jgi:AcrR family transcriptional regulator